MAVRVVVLNTSGLMARICSDVLVMRLGGKKRPIGIPPHVMCLLDHGQLS